MAVANISRSYGSSKTYSFNKSINQYFISGYLINDGPRVFNGVYNNGTNFGWIFEYYPAVGGGVGSANATNVSCSANGITIDSIYSGIDFNLSAVIIYPAIYGNVTIS